MRRPLRTEELAPLHDDRAADHLPGMALPTIELPSTEGGHLSLSDLERRTVVFVYPSMQWRPDMGFDDVLLEEWSAIPGARGCTPEACGFRDRLGCFASARADVLGLSGQSAQAQREAVERLALSYPLLCDEALDLAGTLGLPTFEFHGGTYFKRLTLVVCRGAIEAALYPVFPPDEAAEQALAWLAENPSH